MGNVLPCGYACHIHELRCESSAPLMETRWDRPWFSEGGEDVKDRRECFCSVKDLGYAVKAIGLVILQSFVADTNHNKAIY